ncbi:MAG: hypothetical protein KDD43_12890 [Bdellovibrionales bacterium]|nr:hypothetical protein [Bdellovibrionales bacterium]
MQKSLIYICLVLLCTLGLALPAQAKSSDKKKKFDFSSLDVSINTEEFYHNKKMLEASKIATLNARSRSRRRCWRAVKRALFEANAISTRPTTRYAKQAGEELEEKYDFIKLTVSDPYDAPVGSLLVYGGPGAGHVEFRIPEGFVSDFFSPHPSSRPLLGVYVRPLEADSTSYYN